LEIRQLARQFAESELRPHVAKWDHDGAIDPAVLAQLAELGFSGMLVPEAFGGMEFDLPTYVAALEELAWGEPAVALTVAITSMVADTIVAHGSDAQKHRWLEALARGDAACIARTEPDDSQTRATRQGNGWLVKGSKNWVSNVREAKLALLTAHTDTGLAAFLTSTDAPGFDAVRRITTMGFRPLDIRTVELHDLRLDAEDRIAIAESDSSYSTTGWLSVAAVSLGIAQAALDHARAYADVREQFATRLRKFEGVQYMLADMTMRTAATRALLQSVAAAPTRAGAAMVKVFASETAMWVTTQAVQIFGGYGYMRDYPVEKLMRDAKATEIMEGSNETVRVFIADALYD
jgi:alkylation response protein AidB-like acyl-CoA dehydrogenase